MGFLPQFSRRLFVLLLIEYLHRVTVPGHPAILAFPVCPLVPLFLLVFGLLVGNPFLFHVAVALVEDHRDQVASVVCSNDGVSEVVVADE